jgi:rubredoxin-NAD+ reductase
MLAFGFSTLAASKYLYPSAECAEEFKEIEITYASEMGDGEMRELVVGEGEDDKVLIAKHDGKIYSVGNFCTHFGVGLANSVLFDDKVLCPAHCAGFSIITGYPENSPGLDGLPVFEVVHKDGKSFVKVPTKLPRKSTMPMAKRDDNDKREFVIIGGGPSGLTAAESLRQSDYAGKLTVLSSDSLLPYDRTILSKSLGAKASGLVLRGEEFLAKYDIDYKLNS